MKRTGALHSRKPTLPKVSDDLITWPSIGYWGGEPWFEIHAGSVGGRHQTSAKVHGHLKLKEHALDPFSR
jgi:hypothetical protein